MDMMAYIFEILAKDCEHLFISFWYADIVFQQNKLLNS